MIVGRLKNIIKEGGKGLLFLFCSFYFFSLCCLNWDFVFFGGQIFFIDADCYTRMYRVLLLENSNQWVIHTHAFENAPYGISPHTTLLLDYAILILSKIFSFFNLTPSLDYAGAFVSPVIGLIAFIYLWFWSAKVLQGSARGMLITAFIFSPPLIFAFQLGRPDHQSLILLFILIFITMLYLWIRENKRDGDFQNHRNLSHVYALITGLSWGAALWVSLFEPLIIGLLTIVIIVFLIKNPLRQKHYFLAALVMIIFLMLTIEGWKIRFSDFAANPFLMNWYQTIGELQGLSAGKLSTYFGWLIWLSPLLLIHGFRKRELPLFYTMITGILFFSLLLLSFYHSRWVSCAGLLFSLSIPPLLGAMKGRVWKWIFFLILISPCVRYLGNESMRRPDPDSLVVQQQDLRYLSQIIPKNQNLIIMAPWWWSPYLLYWTGNPIVASSSHQSIDGIVDSARFYSALKVKDSLEILDKRHVQIVIGYDTPRVLSDSLRILGFKDINDQNVIDTEGYAFSTISRLMDEMREDYSSLDGHLFMQAYSGPMTKYQFRIFWVLDKPRKN
ncbi:MAG: hypothetical protein SGI98_06650 [Verrucomicrobiota bacterium]|nr:hypothetical protein [Verrucomicrobiota bacterium]